MTIPRIDIEYLENVFGPDDINGAERLFRLAYKVIDEDLEKLANERSDEKRIKIAHRLKGVTANIGAAQLSHEFFLIEKNANSQINFENLNEIYRITKMELSDVIARWRKG